MKSNRLSNKNRAPQTCSPVSPPAVPSSATDGRIFFLTPGLSYALTPSKQLCGMVQLLLYHYVNGEQLTANSSFTLGVSHRF